MTKPRVFLSLILLAVLLAACAPAASAVVPTQPVEIVPTLPLPTPNADSPLQATSTPAETLAPTALPIATSRGLHLEATDPTTVNMASGGLQLVEFFEFW